MIYTHILLSKLCVELNMYPEPEISLPIAGRKYFDFHAADILSATKNKFWAANILYFLTEFLW